MKEKVIHIGRRIISHELISGSSFLFIGTIFANFFAFLFNLLLVRNLSYIQYGEYTALISLISFATIPSSAIQPVIVQYASRFFGKKQENKARSFYLHSSQFLVLLGVLTFGCFLIFSSILEAFFHLASFSSVFFAGLISLVMYGSVVNIAFLQSMVRFGFLAITTSLGGIVKALAGMFFILLGWKLLGAFSAIFLSLFIPLLITYIPLTSFTFTKGSKQEDLPLKEIFRYAFPTIVSVLALTAFTSTDILLVKHFFSGHDAGLYSGLSLVGRIIFYFTAPITTVMFPLVIKRYEQGRNFHALFYAALISVLLPSLLLTAFYTIFPVFTVEFFLGGKGYLAVTPYLGVYGLFLTIFSVLNVFVNFFLSLKKTRVMILLLLGWALQIGLIVLFHQNFWSVILDCLCTVIVLLISLLLYYLKFYGTKKEF